MTDHQQTRRRHPRIFRERKNVLDIYDDTEHVMRYRLAREGIVFMTDLVRQQLQSRTECNHPVTPEMKALFSLLRGVSEGCFSILKRCDDGLLRVN
ncbi:hypothetical protein E2C01_038251 [Portunus trituberculatus]|uniref:Uncharacterized protein n=1 Tax=Portunus trituberculatus TaxID=210409 RepID=A0A5B7FJG6_PORTR|nr:hypothetical protein [Portunus trituberculatus]